MPDILSLLSIAFLPLLITTILVWGIWKKVPIYDTFIKGAKDGLKTSVEILPFLLGIFLAIGALTSSGAMGFLQETTRPFFEKIGIPQELISLILLRPVSGSGSLVLAQQIMEVTGPDSFAGRAASVMVGSCETVFYVLALYFGVTSVKKMRHAFLSGIAGYIAGVMASVYLSYHVIHCPRILDPFINFLDLPAVASSAVVYGQLREIFQFSAASQHTVDQDDIGCLPCFRHHKPDRLRFQSASSAAFKNIDKPGRAMHHKQLTAPLQDLCSSLQETIQISRRLMTCTKLSRPFCRNSASLRKIRRIAGHHIKPSVLHCALPHAILCKSFCTRTSGKLRDIAAPKVYLFTKAIEPAAFTSQPDRSLVEIQTEIATVPAACLVMKNKRNDSCPGSQVSRIPVSAAYRRRKISQDHRIYAIAEFRRILQKF